MPAEITVRPIRAEEWKHLRAIRLRALADAPMAFGATLAGEQAQPDEFWRERAAGGVAPARTTFIAERGGVWVGLGTCVLQAEGAGVRPAWIFGMWVEPAARRQGTAQALLRAIAYWARERGVDVLNLHVTATNTPAIALYERLGFHATGATVPLPHTPGVREHHMICALEQFRSDGGLESSPLQPGHPCQSALDVDRDRTAPTVTGHGPQDRVW